MGDPAREKTARFRAILGVGENATRKDLKKAYHAKVAKLHPDLHPDDPQAAKAFKKVNTAYEYLKKHLKDNEIAGAKPGPAEKRLVAATAVTQAPRTSSSAADPVISLDELVMRLRHSQNEYLRMYAVKAVAAAGGREAVWALLPSLGDPSPKVAAAAVSALGEMKARLAAAPLIKLLAEADPALKPLILEALKKIDSPAAARFLADNHAAAANPAARA